MAICIKCYCIYSDKRHNLGYKTCLECGDKEAQKEADRKSNYIAPLFNKGGYQYIGNLENIKIINN